MAVARRVREQPKYFLNRYFTEVMTREEDVILYDVEDINEGVAPFVHPLHEGKIMRHRGYRTKFIRPAYVKEKVIHDPELPLTRMAGEDLGGAMSAEQRMRLHVVNDVSRLKERLKNREDVMAHEIVKKGGLTVVGEGFQEYVDFGRDKALTVSLQSLKTDFKSGWDNPDFPMTDFLEGKSRLISDLSMNKSQATDLHLSSKAWELFRRNKEVVAAGDLRRGVDITLVMTPTQQAESVHYKGRFGDFEIFVHYGTYLDGGREKKYFDPGEALLAAKSVGGVRYYGKIRDKKAQLRAMDYFMKSWEQDDPCHTYIMIQSAPLLVSKDPNTACLMQVV
jgi:hypothetical protein